MYEQRGSKSNVEMLSVWVSRAMRLMGSRFRTPFEGFGLGLGFRVLDWA